MGLSTEGLCADEFNVSISFTGVNLLNNILINKINSELIEIIKPKR
jgi:hypothetical protein